MHENFISYSELMAISKNNGFIYIFSNPSYPDSIKIGKTTRLPGYRAAGLSKSTSVPSEFVLEWCRFVKDDLSEIELMIHRELNNFRINERREFFKLSLSDAIKKLDEIIDKFFSVTWGEITYRKRQDARWGIFFKNIKIPFEYMTEQVKIIDGVGFMPDFWLPEQDCYVIVSQDFLYTNSGRMMAYLFAQKTGKVIFQLWDCGPGVEYQEIGYPIIDYGSYMTPEGELDGGMEFGICNKCGSRHIGHIGFPELGDGVYRQTSKNSCHCYRAEPSEELLNAYDKVKLFLGSGD